MLSLDDMRPAYRSAPALPATPQRIALRSFEAIFFIWLLTSFYTVVQPSPYELVAILVGLACIPARVLVDAKIIPMVFLLTIIQIGGILSYLPIIGDTDARNFILISIYLSFTGIIFAIVLLSDTLRRFNLIFASLVLAAVIAASLGIIGYFNLLPGSEIFMFNGRAASTFKDPNYTGAYYIPPLLFLLAVFFTSRIRPLHLIAFFVIAAGLLLAFSRAAWGQFVFTTIVLWLLLFITRQTRAQRARMLVVALVMLVALVALLVVLFSIESVRTMILERAVLFQSYDTGTEGSRFNVQQRSIEELFDHANGMGPWVFARQYGLVSHNSYLGMFLNHGWIGGIFYLVLTVLTLSVGFRSIYARTPWQVPMIATLAAYVGMCVESLIIDTDHWRGYYMLVGMVWGMAAATVNYQRRNAGAQS